jgi:hypothetical protein
MTIQPEIRLLLWPSKRKYFSDNCIFWQKYLLALVIASNLLLAQNPTTSLQYFADYRYSPTFIYEGNIGYQRLLASNAHRVYEFNQTLTQVFSNWFKVEGGMDMSYTYDEEYPDFYTINPWLRTTLTWPTQGGLLHLYFPYLGITFEQSLAFYPHAQTWNTDQRMRVRIGTRVPLNRTIITAETYYLHFRYDYFYDPELNIDARFISRRQLFLGFGYDFNLLYRAEFRYTWRESRNTAEEDFNSSGSIFSLFFFHNLSVQ